MHVRLSINCFGPRILYIAFRSTWSSSLADFLPSSSSTVIDTGNRDLLPSSPSWLAFGVCESRRGSLPWIFKPSMCNLVCCFFIVVAVVVAVGELRSFVHQSLELVRCYRRSELLNVYLPLRHRGSSSSSVIGSFIHHLLLHQVRSTLSLHLVCTMCVCL